MAVGIFGDWGSGKSTILEVLRARLLKRRSVVVYTRPWEYDPNIDPQATLIAEVLSPVGAEVARDEGRMAQLADRFKGLVPRVQWSKAVTLVTNLALTLSIPKITDVVDLFGNPTDDGLSDPRFRASATSSTSSSASWRRSTGWSCWSTRSTARRDPLGLPRSRRCGSLDV